MTQWWPIPLVLIIAAYVVYRLLTYREREYLPPSDD